MSIHIATSCLFISLFKSCVIGRRVAPKDVHVLLLRTCEYVFLHCKKDLVDVVKVKNVVMRTLSWIIQMDPS